MDGSIGCIWFVVVVAEAELALDIVEFESQANLILKELFTFSQSTIFLQSSWD